MFDDGPWDIVETSWGDFYLVCRNFPAANECGHAIFAEVDQRWLAYRIAELLNEHKAT